MNAQQASRQIAEIQRTLTAAQAFHGYRAQTVALTGLMALVISALQSLVLPRPVEMPFVWLPTWVATAAVCGSFVVADLALRCWRAGSAWQNRLTMSAVLRFAPTVVVGGALTATLATTAPQCLWMLPGLWSLLISQGVASSLGGLPRCLGWASLYYLIAGVVCLVWANGPFALAPEAMGLTFGVGQLLTAALLHWGREDRHGVV